MPINDRGVVELSGWCCARRACVPYSSMSICMPACL